MSFHTKLGNIVLGVVELVMSTNTTEITETETESDDGLPPIVKIIFAATSASLEIFLGMAIGVLLSHPRVGILSDKNIRKAIGKMWVYIFTPLFMIRNFGSALDLEMAVDIWILPLWGCIHLVFGYIIAEFCFPMGIFRCLKTSTRRFMGVRSKRNRDLVFEEESNGRDKLTNRKDMRRVNRTIYVLASSIPNSTFLPIVFITGFYSEEEDRERVITFISLYSIPLFVFFYGYIFNYMKWMAPKEEKSIPQVEPDFSQSEEKENEVDDTISDDNEEEEEKEGGESGEEEYEGVVDPPKNREMAVENNNDDSNDDHNSHYDDIEKVSDNNNNYTEKIRQRRKEESEEESEESSEESEESSEESSEPEDTKTKKKKIMGFLRIFSCCSVCSKILLNPVLVGIFIGVIVAIIPGAKGFIFEDEPPVFVAFTNIMNKMANCVLGLSLVIVGANLGAVMFPVNVKNEKEKGDEEKRRRSRSDLKKENNEEEEDKVISLHHKLKRCTKCCWRNTFKLKSAADPCLVLKVLFFKLIFIPILTFAIVSSFILTLGPYVIQKEEYRAMIYLVFLVESTVPLMMSLNMVAAMFDFGVDVLSTVMLCQYLVAPFTMGIFTTIFLYFICSIEECTIL